MSTLLNHTGLVDDAARARIRDDLEHTLFVEAGAGSGKTSALVDRVVATVLDGGIPLRHVAAVTFTDKAAAELRDRLRTAFERRQALGEQALGAQAQQVQEALDDLDAAAIGTLHSFAHRILSEHPIEAGLPPLVEVGDEVASQVRFEQRWTTLRGALLDAPDTGRAVLLGLAAGLRLPQLRSIALIFNGEWDRLESTVLAAAAPTLPALGPPALASVLTEARSLCALEPHCTDESDTFLGHLRDLRAWADRLDQATDEPARLELLVEGQRLKHGQGQKGNWPQCDLAAARARLKGLGQHCAALVQELLDAVLRTLARAIATATLEAARERSREGSLEFHDLLVLARAVLGDPVHGHAVRARLHQRYQRLLLDEFQDTDPIQVELAVRIAAGASATAAPWQDVVVPAGRLFVVGDPKQSIYRFRRADIAMYLQARDALGEPVALTTNFRSTRRVLDWINMTFGQLITPVEGSQPAYQALAPHRDDAAAGTQLVALGVIAHPHRTGADAVRAAEAADVAAVIQTALAEGWQVLDQRTKAWRGVTLGDIAVLVPARTSLPQLEEALDDAGIPYRAEASSLVYRTAEVRDLLMAARAVDDPSDALALVSVLRSPLFGCGDDDLFAWRHAGGSFHLLAPSDPAVLASLPQDHPVPAGIAYLRARHEERTWRAPSELLDQIVRDRRMLELAGRVRDGGDSRTRDVWRRLRFVVDHARAWSESERGGLRAYLAWASRQGDESARVAEAVLPETDADAVRIMTIHAAKGLEFPVVIASGLSSRPMVSRGVQVLWPRAGGYEIKVGTALQTGDFEVAKPIDEQMGYHERIRLLYVACTRARDHLVVSFHREERKRVAEAASQTNAELLFDSVVSGGLAGGLAGMRELSATGSPPPRVTVSAASSVVHEPFGDWQERVRRSRVSAARASTISASSLEGGDDADVDDSPVEPGLAKGPRDLELPPWNKGRYGTAIGRAVHGALQTVDLVSGAGLDDAVDAQVLAEGVGQHRDLAVALCRSALASPTVRRAAARPHWRETYVGTPLHSPEGPEILEGFVDLLYREDDGSLVIVDYKTDAVPEAALASRAAFYRPQMRAYGQALTGALGEPVTRAVLVFLHPEAVAEREVSLI